MGNEIKCLSQTWSLKVEFDPLDIELVTVQPNPVRVLILTQRYDRGHASMDRVL